MKISIFIFAVLIATTFSLRGQNNLDFETWVTNPQGIEEPEFWETNNVQNFISVSKSTNSISGNFAALIKSNGISFEGKAPGILQATWSNLSIPTRNISFKIKIDSISSNATAMIIITGFSNSNVLYNDTAIYSTTTNGWESKTIILSDTTTTCDSLKVSFIANSIATPTGYVGYAEYLVDNVLINQPLSIIDINFLAKNLGVYPNPSNDSFFIETFPKMEIKSIKLFDNTGKLLRTFEINPNGYNISSLKVGSYFVQISTTKGVITKTIIKR